MAQINTLDMIHGYVRCYLLLYTNIDQTLVKSLHGLYTNIDQTLVNSLHGLYTNIDQTLVNSLHTLLK